MKRRRCTVQHVLWHDNNHVYINNAHVAQQYFLLRFTTPWVLLLAKEAENANSHNSIWILATYRKDRRIRTGECTSIFGFGSYPPKFSYEIPSKFHQKFPPIFVSRTTKFPSFISLHHKISESSDINQDVR